MNAFKEKKKTYREILTHSPSEFSKWVSNSQKRPMLCFIPEYRFLALYRRVLFILAVYARLFHVNQAVSKNHFGFGTIQ